MTRRQTALQKLPLMNGDGIRALIDFTMKATDQQIYDLWLRPAPRRRAPEPQPVSATRIAGGWCVAAMVGNYRESRRYLGYSKRDAIGMFRKDVLR